MPNWLNNRLLIAFRDWRETVRTRGFWLAALLVPIIGLVFAVIAVVVSVASFQSEGRYVVIDYSEGLGVEVEKRLLKWDIRAFVNDLQNQGIPEELELNIDLLRKINELIEDNESADQVTDRLSLKLSDQLDGQNRSDYDQLTDDFTAWWIANRNFVKEFSSSVSFNRFSMLKSKEDLSEEQAKRWLEDGVILGYFIIPENLLSRDDPGNVIYVTTNFLKEDLKDWYAGVLSNIAKERKLQAIQLNVADAAWIQQSIPFATQQLSGEKDGEDAIAERTEIGATDFIGRGAPIGYGYILWFVVFYSSFALLTSVVEEKSTKLVELLLSTVSPAELMDGKSIGILLVVSTTIGFWILSFGVLGLVSIGFMPSAVQDQIQAVIAAIFNPYYLIHFFLYLGLGFMFFGSLLGAIGSVCSNIREAQSLAAPINILMIVPIVVIYAVIIDPSSLAATILSFIPPFTPFVMMFRAADHPDLLTYLLINGWFVAWLVGARFLARRVYTRGILMESKPEGLRQLAKLVKRAEA